MIAVVTGPAAAAAGAGFGGGAGSVCCRDHWQEGSISGCRRFLVLTKGWQWRRRSLLLLRNTHGRYNRVRVNTNVPGVSIYKRPSKQSLECKERSGRSELTATRGAGDALL